MACFETVICENQNGLVSRTLYFQEEKPVWVKVWSVLNGKQITFIVKNTIFFFFVYVASSQIELQSGILRIYRHI